MTPLSLALLLAIPLINEEPEQPIAAHAYITNIADAYMVNTPPLEHAAPIAPVWKYPELKTICACESTGSAYGNPHNTKLTA